MNKSLFNLAMTIAETYDVSTPKDAAVVYSISFQPTKANKINALEHIRLHPGKMAIDQTQCGAKLVELGLESADSGLTQEEVISVWAAASKRFINAASGDITAFVDHADSRSVFVRVELPAILTNPNLKTINGRDKNQPI